MCGIGAIIWVIGALSGFKAVILVKNCILILGCYHGFDIVGKHAICPAEDLQSVVKC